MSDLEELERLLSVRQSEPVTRAMLLSAVRVVAQALDRIEQHRGTLVETVGFVNQLQDRLLLVDELPASAPFGALIRLRTGPVADRAALYLGNGAGQPLSRLTPTAL